MSRFSRALPVCQATARPVAPQPHTSAAEPPLCKPPAARSADSGRVLYFAFGANLAPQVTSRRDLKPRSAVAGTVRNHKLYFQHIGGYATIEYRPDDVSRPDVHGVVMDLSNDEMKRLTAMEGGYDVKDVVVTSPDGTRYHSKAFTTNWSVRLFKDTAPTHDYIGKLRSGADHHSLPAQYQDWLNGIESRGLQETTEKQVTSPSTYIATGFSAMLFTAAVALLVRPR